jgi:predicted CopG family antitoxin
MYTYTYTDMGTKTISIMNDVYDLLMGMKLPNESFSDEIRRLAKTKGSIMDLAGAWSDMSDEEADNLKRNISIGRSETSRLDELDEKY